jgi:predicted dehydrogenase
MDPYSNQGEMKGKLNRREFIKGSALAGAGLSTLAEPVRPVAATDRVSIGIIGCGGMGRMNQTDFQKNPEVEVVAVCDVYQPNLEASLKMTQDKAKAYTDYRKLLENRDVQAVVIATPDHWHPLICIDACHAGKDVYVEKPISNCIREGRLMVEAARRNNRVVQVGLQQRSGTHFQRAVKMVQEGRLGKIHYVQCWNHERANPQGLGNPPDADPPKGLNWDFWLGPAPRVPFNKNRFLGTWRWFFDYGGGKLADWGSHLIDIVHWAMQVEAPLSATGAGGKYFVTDNRETPDTMDVTYEYPGFILHYSTLQHSTYGHNGHPGAKPFGSYGILFQGSLGSLFIDRAGYEVIPQMVSHTEPNAPRARDVDDLTGTSLYYTSELTAARATTSLQHPPHVRNFLDCLRTRARPRADIEIGHQATAACHLGNIALRVGQKILWDGKAERITNHDKANEMLTRQYRAPWTLDGL